MNLFRAIVGVSALTTVSRITGLMREVVTAKVFGAGAVNDAFEVAFQIPNMMRRLFAEGAFAQAFVPLLAEYKGSRGEADTHQLINRVATLQLLALLVVSVLGMLAAPWLVPFMASGFSPETEALSAQMTRIMFPYLLFISMVALAGGAMNVWKKFSIPAFTPVLLNVCMIAAAWFLAPHFKTPILALAWGVVAGGAAQLAVQLWALKKLGLFPRFDFHLKDEGVRRMLRTMGPAVLGVSIAQVSLLLNTNYSSHFGPGAVTWLKKADRLMELPSALLGVAIGAVILPALGSLRTKGDKAGYGSLLDYGLRFGWITTLPALAVMVVLAVPMVAVLFHRGAFTARDVLQTAPAVAAYAVGIVALVWIKVLAPAFYAQQDTKTPVKIGVRVLLITQVFNAIFVFLVFRHFAPHLLHAALALSTSLGAILNAYWLFQGLRARGLYVPQWGWTRFAKQTTIATLFTAAVIFLARPSDSWWVTSGEWARILMLTALFTLGGYVYAGMLYCFGYRPRDLTR